MKIKLICSKEIEPLLKEVLNLRGFIISDNADVFLIEKGRAIPDNGISIVFNPEKMDELVEFLKNNFANNQDSNFKKSLPDHLLGHIGENYELIKYEDIIIIETELGDIYARSQHGKDYKLKEKLYELEDLLKSNGFIRINKSNIVNILHINEIVPWFNGRLLLKLKNKKEAEVSRSYASDFKKYLGI